MSSKNGDSAGTVDREINFFTQNIAMFDWSDTQTYAQFILGRPAYYLENLIWTAKNISFEKYDLNYQIVVQKIT